MENQGRGPEISDLQNYLASFNKEIQDGSATSGHPENSASDTTARGGSAAYYVSQTQNAGHMDGYQYSNQNQAQYAGTTYYTSSGATYYTSTDPQDCQQPHVSSYQSISGTGPNSLQEVNAVGANDHSGLQQIVLAVSKARALTTDEPQEISVTIPASMANQVRHVHETTEELLQAVESHGNSGENAETLDQPTFVAMQPGSSHDGHVETVKQEHPQGLSALINQAENRGENVISRTNQAHTIRMVLRQPDGTETEQTIPVTGAPTLLTSDGQEIHVGDEGTLQMMASLAEQAAAAGTGDGTNPVILGSPNSYQTVTIVPSDTNPGEVSYVLIVSQSDDSKDQKDMNLDMSVYDFNEGERHGEIVSEEVGPDGTKMRTIKFTPKKSQIVTQAHMCNYCNYTSPKRYLLSRHMKSHSEERPHKCSVCERGFKTLASLQNHVNTHTGTRPHQCRECEASFTTSGELVRHVRYKHTHEKPHRCTECDYASVELSKLKRHMRCHTGERPYQCPHCTYASPDTYKLKRHLRIHTGEKPYECDICQARFTQSNSLKAHKLIHSGNKPIFQCEYCPTTCGRKTDLRIHVQKLHTSEKPLKCKRCGKSFPDRYNYKIHSKTHEGEKCFKCDLCPYASISHRHLESHMLIHTDQKPFHCDECDQAFRQKQLLKRHKNLYHDPNYIPPVPKEKTHECSECKKAFRHKGNLIRHLAVHDPDATAQERAEAMRIGEPKAPGEQRDGEEDDYLDDEDEDDDDIDGLMSNELSQESQDGQQVVVFEVIQLPTDGNVVDGQTLTVGDSLNMNAANGNNQGVTIIQQVPSANIVDEVAALVSAHQNVELDSQTSAVEEFAAAVINSTQGQMMAPTPRRRGRPRKYPMPTDMTPVTSTITLSKEMYGKFVGTIADSDSIQIGKRKSLEYEPIEQKYTPPTPSRRGRPPKSGRGPGRPPKIVHIEEQVEEVLPESDETITIVIQDPEELARREQEIVQKRLEQKQKDMAECFGFNDDDEEAETILAMPAAPGVQKVPDTELHLSYALQTNGSVDDSS